VLNDLHLATRALLKTPLFTLAALAALALAIGANAAVFGLVNQLLLRPAGIVDPERVVAVQVRYPKLGLSRVPLSVPDFGDVVAARSTFDHAALANFESFNYAGGGIPIRLLGAQVSQQWFDVFGARPEIGRTFREEEDRPNVNTLVVLSWKTWQGVFGGATDIVGRTPESRFTFYNAAIERLRALPGASDAALAILAPFHDSDMTGSFTIAGRVTRPGDPGAHGRLRAVTPGYFPALRIPLKRGRLLTEHDRAGTLPVVVVDENLAREYWPGEDPVGRQIRRGAGPGDGPWQTIVGVVGNVKHSSLSEGLGKGTVYYSLFQEAAPFATIVVRSRADAGLLARAIPRAVAAVDAAQPVFDVRSLEEDIFRSLAPQRFIVQLLVFFAAAALFMAGLGLYTVISYSVTQRVQEIGIRMALGAPRATVRRQVVGEGLWLAGFGAAAGIAIAAAIARLLSAQLFGVGSIDPTALAGTAAILLAVALAATYWPARRASRVDPIVALRAE